MRTSIAILGFVVAAQMHPAIKLSQCNTTVTTIPNGTAAITNSAVAPTAAHGATVTTNGSTLTTTVNNGSTTTAQTAPAGKSAPCVTRVPGTLRPNPNGAAWFAKFNRRPKHRKH